MLISFTNHGPAIQIAVPKGKYVIAKFYKGKVLHKLKKYFEKNIDQQLVSVVLLHDKASSNKAAIVREYLKQEKVVELLYPPFLPDPAPCDFFIFPRLKKNSILDEKQISVRLFPVYLQNTSKR
jgi:histone-lysine N-methyltransferase SETMAR